MRPLTTDRKPVRLRGRVALQTVQRGTASEHEGLVLSTADGRRLILVRIGSNPFEDNRSRTLDGTDVEVEGFIVGGEFRYRELRRY
jgi:hypothetical protein